MEEILSEQERKQINTRMGHYLRDRRLALGLKQNKAAERLGWAKSHLSDLERGIAILRFVDMVAMGRLYGVTMPAMLTFRVPANRREAQQAAPKAGLLVMPAPAAPAPGVNGTGFDIRSITVFDDGAVSIKGPERRDLGADVCHRLEHLAGIMPRHDAQERVAAIGRQLHEHGGLRAMRAVRKIVGAKLPRAAAARLDGAWEGIGEWRR